MISLWMKRGYSRTKVVIRFPAGESESAITLAVMVGSI